MIIQVSGAVAANSVNTNIVSGQSFEFLPSAAVLEIAINGSATGLLADISIGGRQVALGASLNSQNRFPVYPDDLLLSEAALAGERIVIQVRNSTAGSLTYFATVRINPV